MVKIVSVATFDTLYGEWIKHRIQLERAFSILVVDDDPNTGAHIDGLLRSRGVSSKTVTTAPEALKRIASEGTSLVVVSENLHQMRGMTLIQQLRMSFPEVDVVITSKEPSLDLFEASFKLRVLDVLSKPFPRTDDDVVGERLLAAMRRNIDRRMRVHVLKQLKAELKQLSPKIRRRATKLLDQRLAGFKRWIGAFNGVLVVEEQDPQMRVLSENLLVAGMYVQATENIEEALKRIAKGSLHLLIVKGDLDGDGLAGLLGSLGRIDPLIELMLVTDRPDVQQAAESLRQGIASYLPWQPGAPSKLTVRVQDILRRSRRDRLMDNLLTALFQETQSAQNPSISEENFTAFCKLVGMERIIPLDQDGAQQDIESADAMAYLENVLDHILAPDDASSLGATSPSGHQDEDSLGGHERRAHFRVPENQFIRFRPRNESACTLAYVGDISEGGLFIRTQQILSVGTYLDVDVNLEYDRQGYVIRCRGEVAWVAQDHVRSPHGQGFGIKFIEPPQDVRILLQRVVRDRIKRI